MNKTELSNSYYDQQGCNAPLDSNIEPQCKMCHIICHKNSNKFAYDKPIISTPNFIVIPTIGQIVEGYLLILPKRHILSMGELDTDSWIELKELKSNLRKILENEFGPVIFFEHGSIPESNKAGNSILHAHMHVCPAPSEILNSVLSILPMREVEIELFARTSYISGKSYLFIEDHNKKCFGCNAPIDLPSQFLRRHLSNTIGISDKWDWRIYPHRENIASTMKRLNVI